MHFLPFRDSAQWSLINQEDDLLWVNGQSYSYTDGPDGVEAEGQIERTSDTQGTEKEWSTYTDAPTPSPTNPISVAGMCDADDRCVSSPNFQDNYGTSFFCSITFDVGATLHVVEFETVLSFDVLPLEDWVVDVRENPAAQPGWIHQVPDRWPCEAVYGCLLCSSILARGAHEWYVAAARVRAGSLESSEPFEVSADGQRSRVGPHGTMFVDENGVTLRGDPTSGCSLPWETQRCGLSWSAMGIVCASLWCMPSRTCTYSRDQTTSTGTVIPRSFVLYSPWIPGEHRGGICAVECVTARLRGSRSQVVFWIDEWSIEFGYHWLDVAHVRDHSPLSAPLCRY